MKRITPILNRIKHILGAKTDRQMAQIWGVSYSTLDTWKNRDKIPEKRLLDFALKYGVSLDYLLTGEGEAQARTSSPNLQQSVRKYISEDDNRSKKAVEAEVLSVRPGAGRGTELEAVDLFATGEKIFIDRSLLKSPPVGKLKAMQIDGYSMVPMLFPDSWVIIDETKEFRGDGLYVLNFDNVLMVKLLEANLSSGTLWVRSVNPQYDSWEIKADDQRVFEIYGKVVRCLI